VTFALIYHPLAVSHDISRINKNLRQRIGKAVKERLETHPESYGKPLRGSLSGYWKLRVGDFRIIYRIVKSEVWIYGVINRRDVYEDILKRLSWKS